MSTHDVHFYGSERGSAERIGPYLVDGIQAGEDVICIARASPRHSLEDYIRGSLSRLDVVTHYTGIDAMGLLAQCMAENQLEWDPFLLTMRALFRRTDHGRGMRIYAEMGPYLLKDTPHLALRLEDFANHLATLFRFNLVCGYPLSLFTADPGSNFVEVCARHQKIVLTTA
jgi:hypothetical protein